MCFFSLFVFYFYCSWAVYLCIFNLILNPSSTLPPVINLSEYHPCPLGGSTIKHTSLTPGRDSHTDMKKKTKLKFNLIREVIHNALYKLEIVNPEIALQMVVCVCECVCVWHDGRDPKGQKAEEGRAGQGVFTVQHGCSLIEMEACKRTPPEQGRASISVPEQ